MKFLIILAVILSVIGFKVRAVSTSSTVETKTLVSDTQGDIDKWIETIKKDYVILNRNTSMQGTKISIVTIHLKKK
jgi:hypothetical protein